MKQIEIHKIRPSNKIHQMQIKYRYGKYAMEIAQENSQHEIITLNWWSLLNLLLEK